MYSCRNGLTFHTFVHTEWMCHYYAGSHASMGKQKFWVVLIIQRPQMEYHVGHKYVLHIFSWTALFESVLHTKAGAHTPIYAEKEDKNVCLTLLVTSLCVGGDQTQVLHAEAKITHSTVATIAGKLKNSVKCCVAWSNEMKALAMFASIIIIKNICVPSANSSDVNISMGKDTQI